MGHAWITEDVIWFDSYNISGSCIAQRKHVQNKGFILFSMRGSRGTGVQNPPPPPPPPKIIKLPSLHSMLEHHRSASETPFKWRFAFCGIWIHSTHQLKNAVRVGASVSRSVREVKGPMCRFFLLSTVCF